MQTVVGIENFKAKPNPVYLALGNFDGVHKGHQSLIQTLIDDALAHDGQKVAFIFEPHPAQVLAPEKAPRLLLTPLRKGKLLEKMGLDVLIYNPFTRDIAAWSPQEFVERILVNHLHVQGVYVGFNYTFGHKGAGTPELLQEMGNKYGFEVNIIPPVKYGDEPISSSLVRKSLEEGDVITAYQMLGYYPIVEGIVVEGEHRGAALGFPTANVGVQSIYNVPGKGVYAAWAGLGEKTYPCVVNIGSKPTFHQSYPISIEAHLMEFNQDIYGQEIKLCFLQKLRDEKRFASLQELVVQIAADRDKAQAIIEAAGWEA